MSKDEEKALAARAAMEYIEDGMIVGLGTGSTAAFAIRELGRLVAEGLEIFGIPTSEEAGKLAEKLHIPLLSLENAERIDITIDGADEFDPYMQLIKGGGGALLREKIIAYNSEKNVIIADSSKQVSRLGAFRLPVEVVPFAIAQVTDLLEDAGLVPQLRKKESRTYKTDEGNFILDLDIRTITNIGALDDELHQIPGIVETGLFLTTTDVIIVGKGTEVEIIQRLPS